MTGRGVADSERPNGVAAARTDDEGAPPSGPGQDGGYPHTPGQDGGYPHTPGQDGGYPQTTGAPVTPPAPPAFDLDARNRRSTERVDVLWSVDCETEETFLYAAITNISEMGIFVRTTDPLAVGTSVLLRFAPPRPSALGAPDGPFVLTGVVQWVNQVRPRADNPNPGMGIRFATLTLADRERIVETIRTIAYLREEPRPRGGSHDPRN